MMGEMLIARLCFDQSIGKHLYGTYAKMLETHLVKNCTVTSSDSGTLTATIYCETCNAFWIVEYYKNDHGIMIAKRIE